MTNQSLITKDTDPMRTISEWLVEARQSEPNDPDAIALATTDRDGAPNVRMVLLREIEADAFVFYTNYNSQKAQEIDATRKAAFVLHWKSLRRQVRVRGNTSRAAGDQADAYFASRSPASRIGAWASRQSQPLKDRESLLAKYEDVRAELGENPPRPEFWGGFRIEPVEIELWIDGEARLHDRFQWRRKDVGEPWAFSRLYP